MFLVCGEALYDVFIAGETPNGFTLDARIGGSPFNVAIGLARLGQRAGFFAGLSTDPLGARLVAALGAEGIETGRVVRKANPTTLALVGVGPDGGARYSFYTLGAADRSLTEAEIPDLAGVTAVHFGSFSLVVEPTAGTLLTLATRAAQQGALVSLDPNLRLNVDPDLGTWQRMVDAHLALADLVKVSEEDLASLYPGRPVEDAARDWQARGPALVVVTLGSAGAFAASAHGIDRVPGRQVDVIDTVGAGDTFQAALLAGLAERDRATPAGLRTLPAADIAPLLDFATRAAAITVTRRGADLPRRHELPA